MQPVFNNDLVYTIKSKSMKPSINNVLENVPFMDTKNITDLICNEYVDYELICKSPFLRLFLTHITSIFDKTLYLNRKLDTIYIVGEFDINVEALSETFGQYIIWYDLSFIEQYLVVQFNLFLNFITQTEQIDLNEWNKDYDMFKSNDKYKNNVTLFELNTDMNISNWTDFLQIKIQQPILLINPDLLNEDSRSTRSTSYLYKAKSNNNEDNSLVLKHEIGKRIKPIFDIYCENGFTILDYLVHFLTIRGNPLDRWYTLFSEIYDRNSFKIGRSRHKVIVEFEEKYAKMVENGEIKDDYITLYFSFDHGS